MGRINDSENKTSREVVLLNECCEELMRTVEPLADVRESSARTA